jgi:CheY-like chemotaxis protein
MSGEARTVIIVEDNALVAKFFRMALERAGGFRCIVTEDLEEILRHAREGTAQMAIVDVSLANAVLDGRYIDGVELTQLIKRAAAERGAKFPVLLATAHAMTGDREKLLEASGAEKYLEKPVYDAERLVAELREMLG